jgi:hypothetical protein
MGMKANYEASWIKNTGLRSNNTATLAALTNALHYR